MKICWDMLEGVKLTRTGTFRKGTVTYIYREFCAKCNEPYLTRKDNQSNFCSFSCANKDRKLPDWWKKKISVANSDRNHPMYGKPRTFKTIKKLSAVNIGKSNPMYGKTHTVESKAEMSESSKGKFGILNPNYKGDKAGFAIYNTYKDRLVHYEDVRKQRDTKLLEIKCVYCGIWFVPTFLAVKSRLSAINNLNQGEQRFYCSENCKQSCPTYYQKTYPKGFKQATSREVSTYLRQMVFERDNWECQKCGKTIKDIALHCHHIKGYAQNKILANDADNCITLCKECHKEVHKLPGCNYYELRCENDE